MTKEQLDAIKRDLVKIQKQLGDGEIDFEEASVKLIELMVKAAPDELKKSGMLTEPDKIKLAFEAAWKTGQMVAAQLSLLLITKPTEIHECRLVIPPIGTTPDMAKEMAKDLKEAMRAEDAESEIDGPKIAVMPLGKRGEVVKDGEFQKDAEGMPGFVQKQGKA